MKGYRKPSGVYLEVSDATPVSSALVEVAIRPSVDHVFSNTWNSGPMNASVCWRAKTVAEVTAGKDVDLQAFLDSAGGTVVKALFLVGVDKGFWTLAEVRAKYRGIV